MLTHRSRVVTSDTSMRQYTRPTLILKIAGVCKSTALLFVESTKIRPEKQQLSMKKIYLKMPFAVEKFINVCRIIVIQG